MPDSINGKFCIYEITGPTGVYIGKTNNLRTRWNRHKCAARKGANTYLHRAINYYGADSFSVAVLAECITEADAYWCEQQIIAQTTEPLYNHTTGGRSGAVQSKETREKISAALKGRKVSLSTRQLMSKIVRGRKLSAETRAKISAVQRGRKLSEEHKQKLRISPSPETRAKISAALKGRPKGPQSPEHREKNRLTKIGKKHTEEAKRKIAEAGRNRGRKNAA